MEKVSCFEKRRKVTEFLQCGGNYDGTGVMKMLTTKMTKMTTGWSSVPWEWRGVVRILNWQLENLWRF